VQLIDNKRFEISDKDLWDELRAGGSHALFEIYKRLHVPLVNYCFRICGNKQLAQDTFSEFMIGLWDKREKLGEVTNVKSYLMTSLRRQLLADMKTTQDFDQVTDVNAHSEGSYEDIIIDAQDQEKLKNYLSKAFAKLAPRQRQFITLRFYDGLTYEEIALQEGVDIKAVYNKVYEGIKILRQHLPVQYKNGPSLILFLLLFQLDYAQILALVKIPVEIYKRH
jgi:RNA polymerase sigma-70 factor (ECF subfamily)